MCNCIPRPVTRTRTTPGIIKARASNAAEEATLRARYAGKKVIRQQLGPTTILLTFY